MESQKDAFPRVARFVATNPALSLLLKFWACDVLDLTDKPSLGLRKNVTFTCRFVESEERLGTTPVECFQVVSAEVEDYTESSVCDVDIATELKMREAWFRDPMKTRRWMERVSTLYKSLPPGPERNDMKKKIGIDIPLIVTIKSDVEGATNTVRSIERLYWICNTSERRRSPYPLIWLL